MRDAPSREAHRYGRQTVVQRINAAMARRLAARLPFFSRRTPLFFTRRGSDARC